MRAGEDGDRAAGEPQDAAGKAEKESQVEPLNLSGFLSRILEQLSITSWLPAAMLTANASLLLLFRKQGSVDVAAATIHGREGGIAARQPSPAEGLIVCKHGHGCEQNAEPPSREPSNDGAKAREISGLTDRGACVCDVQFSRGSRAAYEKVLCWVLWSPICTPWAPRTSTVYLPPRVPWSSISRISAWASSTIRGSSAA